jgi:hypothetical protein
LSVRRAPKRLFRFDSRWQLAFVKWSLGLTIQNVTRTMPGILINTPIKLTVRKKHWDCFSNKKERYHRLPISDILLWEISFPNSRELVSELFSDFR